jgi:uncharacterized protein (DUF1015 family)
MPRISPFIGLHFDRARIRSFADVTAPPYDVISPAEHARFLAASPFNVIRLDLGHEPGRPDGHDRYERAAADLTEWRRAGILVPTPAERYFPYEMTFSLHGRRRRLRGLVAAVDLEDWGGDIVPHERTMAAPVEDRLQLMRALEANLSSIYTVFPGPRPELAEWLDELTEGGAEAELVDADGVEHRMWEASPEPGVAGWLEREPLMIADGHHRYATALRYRDERRRSAGPGPWDAVLMFLVDGALEEPPVLPFHRVRLTGRAPVHGARVRDLEEVLETVDDRKVTYGSVSHGTARSCTASPSSTAPLRPSAGSTSSSSARTSRSGSRPTPSRRRRPCGAARPSPRTSSPPPTPRRSAP